MRDPRTRVRVAPHVVTLQSGSGEWLAAQLWRVPLNDIQAVGRLVTSFGVEPPSIAEGPDLERLAFFGLLVCEVPGLAGELARGTGPVDLRSGSDDGTPPDPMDGTVAHISGESVSVHFVRTGPSVEMSREVHPSTLDSRPTEPSTAALRALLLGYARAEGAEPPQETWQEAVLREHVGMAVWKDVGASFGVRPDPPKLGERRTQSPHSKSRRYDDFDLNPHFVKVARDRRSMGDFDERPVNRDTPAVHLADVCGLRSSWRGRWGHVVVCTSIPSAGALQALDVTRRLSRAAAMSTGATGTAPAMVVHSADDARTHGKCAGFPYANAYKEAGATLRALQYSTVDFSLGTRPSGGVIDEDFRRVVPRALDDHVARGAAVVGSHSAEYE